MLRCLPSMSGPRSGARVVAVAHGDGGHAFGEAGCEFGGDAGLHVDSVRGDAGLSAVAQFRDEGSFDGDVEVGVVEHDQGCVTAQFHGGVHDVLRGLGQEQLPDLC